MINAYFLQEIKLIKENIRKYSKTEGKYSGDIRTGVQFATSLSPIVMPWEATIGT